MTEIRSRGKAREWTISTQARNGDSYAHGPDTEGVKVHVIEKLPNSIQLTREQLRDAMKKIAVSSSDYYCADMIYQDDMMDELFGPEVG